MLFYYSLSCAHTFTSCKDASSTKMFTVAVCHLGYMLKREVCTCNTSHPGISCCDQFNRYVYIGVSWQQQNTLSICIHIWSDVFSTQEGLYASVNESSNELHLVPGTPPSFLNCSCQGGLPGCLFMFDQVDQQCANGRTGEHSCSLHL